MDQTQGPLQDIETVAKRILDESTTPKTPGEQRRQSLIEVAYHLIAERGFEQHCIITSRVKKISYREWLNIFFTFPGLHDPIALMLRQLHRCSGGTP
ncbi:hypothetical protein KSC_005340 [Ktedonobacter sp. SOSP1-52]|nr:hypothetical protein KSC_005340 [Ktedonobacter sp. SOSP1-52]